MKSIKNPVELEGFRQSHIRDGVALARYFSWLENELEEGNVWNEWDAAGKLEALRGYVLMCFLDRRALNDLICREEKHFKGLSFDTISSTGPNGGKQVSRLISISSLCLHSHYTLFPFTNRLSNH